MNYVSFKPQIGVGCIIATPFSDIDLLPLMLPLVNCGFVLSNIINVTDDVVNSSIPVDELVDYLNVKKDLKNQIQPLTAEEENILNQLQDENCYRCV